MTPSITTWDLKDVEIEVQNMVATYALHYPEDYDGNDKFTGEPQAVSLVEFEQPNFPLAFR